MTWGLAHPSPEHEPVLFSGEPTETALERMHRTAAVGHPVGTGAAVPQLSFTTTVDARELLLFRSDLRSTLEGVVVCAAGRALSTNPDLNVTVAESPGGAAIVPATSASVQLLVLCDDGLRAGTVDAGERCSLLDVRDTVAILVDGLRAGRLPRESEDAALSVSTFALSGPVQSHTIAPPVSAALAVGRLARDGTTMRVQLSVDARVIEADQASRLLRTLVRLLEHPYRRLL